MTATRATHRLRALGYVVLVQESTFHLAHTFRLGRTDTLPKYLIVGECITTPSAAHDVFRFFGLGKTGAAVWAALSEYSPMTAQDLTAHTGRSLRAVNRTLERMFQLQLVGMDFADAGAVWYALETADLDQAARLIGTFGAGERQRADHTRQRAERARQRADYRHKYNGSKASAEAIGT